MLRSSKELNGYTVLDLNGEAVGTVDDLLFDDLAWVMRYLVVDLGVWLPGRKVLVPPGALEQPDWGGGVSFPVKLTKAQIERGPDIDADQPISRQQEEALHDYFQWQPYWRDVTPFDAQAAGVPTESYLETMRRAGREKEAPTSEEMMEKVSAAEHTGDPHLRSSDEVFGYDIQATDGAIGHVEDFIIDTVLWTIRYIVVDTRNWLPGKKVLIAPQWVKQFSWQEADAYVDLTRTEIKESPEYDPAAPVNRGYEERLYDYYGRPKYWL